MGSQTPTPFWFLKQDCQQGVMHPYARSLYHPTLTLSGLDLQNGQLALPGGSAQHWTCNQESEAANDCGR